MTNGTKQVKCQKCNGCATIEMRGHLESIRCDHCGWIESSTIDPGGDVALIGDSQELVEVQITWSGPTVTPSELLKARQTFQELADVPLSELLRRSKGSHMYTVGRFPLSLAVELQERGKAVGIVVSIKARTTDHRHQ